MGKKREGSDKKAQHKNKKKEIEYDFTSLRNCLSRNIQKELIQFFEKVRPVFNQSKEELIRLNKRFDSLEYELKALVKKECFSFNKEGIEPQMINNSKLKDKEQEINEFEINEKYLASIFEKEKEEIKDNSNNSNSISNNKLPFSSEDKSEYIIKKQKNKSRIQTRSKQKHNIEICEDSDSFNNPREPNDDDNNNNQNIIEPTQSNDFIQQLFDYKSFTNSQSQGISEVKDTKGNKIQSSINSWLKK